jgi:hypothetical protein
VTGHEPPSSSSFELEQHRREGMVDRGVGCVGAEWQLEKDGWNELHKLYHSGALD